MRQAIRVSLENGALRDLESQAAASTSALPAGSAYLLGVALALAGNQQESMAYLRRAQIAHADDLPTLTYVAAESAGETAAEREQSARCAAAAVSLAPRLPELSLLSEYADARAGSPAKALRASRTLQQAAPDLVEVHALQAAILEMRGDWAGAAEALQALIGAQPNRPDVHRRLGLALLRKGDTGGGRTACRKALDLAPTDVDAGLSLAIASLECGDLSGARAGFKTTLGARAQDAVAHRGLGVVFMRANDMEAAGKELDEALRLAPGDGLTLDELGLLALRRGDISTARARFAGAFEAGGPQRATALANLAAIWLDRGDLKQATVLCRQAIPLVPATPGSGWFEGYTSSGTRAFDQVVAVLRAVVKRNPGYAYANHRLGVAFEKKGNYGDAIAAYKAALKADPDYGHCLESLAWTYLTCPISTYRDPNAALALAQRLSQNPSHPEADAAQTLGIALYRTGDFAAAAASLERSAQLRAGGDGWDRFVLAMARWKLNNQATARRWLAKATAWMDENEVEDVSLQQLRDEAVALVK